MVFSSLSFIFVFLPLFLLTYYMVSSYARNAVLFLGSLIFYTVGVLKQPFYLFLFLLVIYINYRIGLLISEENETDIRKLYLTGGIFFDLMWLFFFKYLAFVCKTITGFLGLILPEGTISPIRLTLVLPLGISFYTFQLVSYLVDVYRKDVAAETSFVDFGAYISMFPQLIAGPIVTYSSVRDTLHAKRTYSFEEQEAGIKTFILGLSLKVILANQFGSLWTNIGAVGYDSISTPLAWLGIFAYSFQLYFDFYGYSLMAVGLGRLLGFSLPVNFRHPYMSVSMTEFWRRWHITLGAWFRNYVYIPLGGNRTTAVKWVRNLFLVWLLTGIWHGAGWNFILWGLLLFVFMFVEKMGLKHFFDRHRALGHLYMFFLIPLSWMVFAITDMGDLMTYITRLFPFFPHSESVIYHGDFVKYLKDFRFIIPAGFLFSTTLPARLLKKLHQSAFEIVLYLILFWASVYLLQIGLNDPFLYFRF